LPFAAGTPFDDNAFADTLISYSGDFTVLGGSTLQTALTDADLTTFGFSYSPGAYVELGFEDNVLVNGPGDDLALFQVGYENSLEITIGGLTGSAGSSATGSSVWGMPVNLVTVDLSSFGLGSGDSVSSVTIGVDLISPLNTLPTLAVAGALNSASPVGAHSPEPGPVALFGVGSVIVGVAIRRQLFPGV
jgi:hypothetical protein